MLESLNQIINLNLNNVLVLVLIVGLLILLLNKYWETRCKWFISIEGNGIKGKIKNNKKGDKVEVKMIEVGREALMISTNKGCGYSYDINLDQVANYINNNTTAIITDGKNDIYLKKLQIKLADDDSIMITGELLRRTRITNIEIDKGSLNSRILLIL